MSDKKECIVCKEANEIELRVVTYEDIHRWWMCLECIGNQNSEWDKAKEIYFNRKNKTEV